VKSCRLRYICSHKYFIQIFGEFQSPSQAILLRQLCSYGWMLKLIYRLETGKAVKRNKGKKKKKIKVTAGYLRITAKAMLLTVHY